MTIRGLLCVFLCVGCLWNVVDSTEWVDDMIKYIVEESEFKLVELMTRLDDDEIFENQVIEEIFIKLMKKLPTLRINMDENFALSANSMPDETTRDKTLMDTSATLFLLVIEDHDGLSISMAESFIDAVAEMATHHYSPKYLLVGSSGWKASERPEELLTYAWSKNQMLDFTILELASIPRYGNMTTSSVTLPTIHRINPFKKEYSTEKWTMGMNNLFPNKLTDMSGYPLKVLGMTKMSSTYGELILKIFAKKFNCSVKFYGSLTEDFVFGDWNALFVDAELHNIDIIPYEFPLNSPNWKNMQPTVTVKMDELCILVPILLSKETTWLVFHLTWTYFLSFGIILFFWIFMRLLRFRTYPWQIFNIGRVLLGVSIRQQPRGNVERIVFLCLLAIFAGYSSTIYAGVIDITWEKEQREVPFESFEDLERSGLPLYVSHSDFNRLTDVLEGPSSVIKNRIVKVDKPMYYALQLREDKNFSCLISKGFMKSIIQTTVDENGYPEMKCAKPCLWNEAYALPLRKRSPYRASFDKLIGRMHSSGIFERELSKETFTVSEPHDKAETISELDENINQLSRQLMILVIVGYALSIFVFLCEIIYHRLSLYINSKKRPRPPPFPFVL